MNESITHIVAFLGGSKVAEFYSDSRVDSDLLDACAYCRIGPQGVMFKDRVVQIRDTLPVEIPAYKGTMSEIWIIAGSVLGPDGNPSVVEREVKTEKLTRLERGHLATQPDKPERGGKFLPDGEQQ